MTDRDGLEVEWQFEAADLSAVERVLHSGTLGVTVSVSEPRLQRDEYWDTAEWRVWRGGFACRVRRKDGAAELTLKALGEATDGLRSRREVNAPLPPETEPGADPRGAASGAAGEMLRALAGGHALERIAAVETTRTVADVADERGHLAEIALDRTIAGQAGGSRATLSRVEIEVAEGEVERAWPLVQALVREADLAPARFGKLAAALQVAGRTPPQRLGHLGPAEVTAEMTAGGVAFAVLRQQVAKLVASEPVARLGEDPEGVHDMRVAIRRLRAAMSTFRAYLPETMSLYREHFGWLAGVLGDVRDLDVQMEDLHEWAAGLEPEDAAALEAIDDVLAKRREAARERMLTALDSEHYTSLLARTTADLLSGPGTCGPERITDVAPKLVRRRHRRLRKAAEALTPQSPDATYHALRIEAKKLRYTVEFVAPVYGRAAKRYAERVTELQDVLGEHQDASVALDLIRRLAGELAAEVPPETILVLGMVAEQQRARGRGLRESFQRAYGRAEGKRWEAFARALRN